MLSNVTSNEINKFGRKRIEKEFTLLISNEDVNEIIKIIKSIEDSTVLIDGLTESVKNEIKKKDGFLGAFLEPLAASLVQPAISSVAKGISGRGVRRAGRGYIDKNV